MSKFSNREKLPINEFSSGLAVAFNRKREKNIESLKPFVPELINKMNKDELMKLDWELSIFDMFNITYCCRLLIKEEKACDKVLESFHKYVYEDVSKIDPVSALTFQDESKIKYNTYFEAINSADPIWNLCKEVWKNILGKPCESSVQMSAMGTYYHANHRYITDIVKGLLKKFELVNE